MKFISLFSFNKKKEKTKTPKGAPEMTNVVNSMFLCPPLYDKLKVKCHPDRFIDEKEKSIAEKLFQELQEYRYNYEKMLEIEIKINNIHKTNP